MEPANERSPSPSIPLPIGWGEGNPARVHWPNAASFWSLGSPHIGGYGHGLIRGRLGAKRNRMSEPMSQESATKSSVQVGISNVPGIDRRRFLKASAAGLALTALGGYS